MRQLRAFVRAARLVCLTTFAYGFYFVGKVSRLTRPGHGWRNGWFRWWARSVCRTLGVRATTTGTPPQDALVVSNHISYLDIPLLASYIDAVFVAKADVADWPLVGTVCRGIDTIFIDRNAKRDVIAVGEEMERRLAAGLGVVVFPEGTSGTGEEVLPFRSSLLEVAARDEVPVHWAAIRYAVPDSEPPVTESVAWGDMPFLPHVWGLLQIAEIRAEVIFGAKPIVDRDRKALAAKLQSAVAEVVRDRAGA